MRALYFDTETSGFIRDPLPLDDPSQPWIVQLAAVLADEDRVWASLSVVIRADGRALLAAFDKPTIGLPRVSPEEMLNVLGAEVVPMKALPAPRKDGSDGRR